MSGDELVIRSRRVATARGVAPAAIRIRAGRVERVGDWHDVAGGELVDAGESVVMPGLVDTHVHVNEPGRTEWEGFYTATRTAAAGGVTTILDMPLNCIPATTSAEGLRVKRAAAERQCWIDVGTIGGVVPGNDGELAGLHAGGVLAFKCFLVPSGVDEFPAVSEDDLRRALPVLDALEATLMVHAELPEPIERAAETLQGANNPRAYARYLASRPPEAEMQAIELVIRLCERFGVRMHIVHLSCADALPLLRTVRARGLRLSVETCPHYLSFAAEDIADGATELKCAPPIRERANRERLWSALRSGDIDMVVSDHSPCPPAMKRREEGDFLRAWGGIASLQLGLSAVWQGARERGLGFDRIVRWMCERPAELAGLRARKGRLDAGCDADLVIWNPESDYEVRADTLYDRHHVSPYIGMCLPGVVEATYLRGRRVYERGTFLGEPCGQLLERESGWRTSPS